MSDRLILELDSRNATHPLPVIVRWLLKNLLRRFGVRCTGVDMTDERKQGNAAPDGRLHTETPKAGVV